MQFTSFFFQSSSRFYPILLLLYYYSPSRYLSSCHQQEPLANFSVIISSLDCSNDATYRTELAPPIIRCFSQALTEAIFGCTWYSSTASPHRSIVLTSGRAALDLPVFWLSRRTGKLVHERTLGLNHFMFSFPWTFNIDRKKNKTFSCLQYFSDLSIFSFIRKSE